MASMAVTWQEQATECVHGIRVQDKVGGIRGRSSPRRDKEAPIAEPEEDIDILEPGAQDKTKESINTCEDAILNPVPHSALSTEECTEIEGFCSPEVAEWISDGEIISDPMQDLNIQTRPEACLPTELFDSQGDFTPDEMTAADMRKEENCTQLKFSPGDIPKSDLLQAAAAMSLACQPPSERSNSDNEHSVCSPPYADESEEEEGVNIDNMSCVQRFSRLYNRAKCSQQSYSTNTSISNEQTATRPAIPSAKQQNELLRHSQCEHTPKGANQEVAQQVLGQSSPPLSNVAMELSNKGGAASQGSVCFVLRKQAGGENGQKDVGLQRIKVLKQRHVEGPLKDSKRIQMKELERERDRFRLSSNPRMESDSCDDSQSDSGVSADFSPCNTMDGNIAPETPSAAQTETPIEREIRRAVEREQSLRRSRGLLNLSTLSKFVDIPLRKSVPCQSAATKSERCQRKDRQFAGRKMQVEIQQELQREQDLVKLGKVPGFYDKGTVRQLKERKQLFEAFQTPSDSHETVSTKIKVTSKDMSTSECQEDISSQTLTKGSHGPIPLIAQGPAFVEGTGCQVLILENDLSVPEQKLYLCKSEARPIPAVSSGSSTIPVSRTGGYGGREGKEQKQESVEPRDASKENPFFKLRSSTNVIRVEQDIQEAKERERELQKQRISLYGSKVGAKEGGLQVERPACTEEKSPMLTPSLNGLSVPDSSSRGATGPPAVSQSVGKFGKWPPVQAAEEITRPEVLCSPRAPRQKTPLVERWESGLVNGYNEEGN